MKRRRNITSDSDIRFKTTIDERNDLQVECFKLNLSMSEVIRKAIYQYLEKPIFTLQNE